MKEEAKISLEDLDKYLEKIRAVFQVEHLVNKTNDASTISKYYTDSSFGYKLFHMKKDALHMSLSYDGKFNEKGYYIQLDEILEELESMNASHVLELASGKGFNSSYLASKLPETHFTGIDFTRKHLKISQNKAKWKENLLFNYGDYHHINFENETFDALFELESLCYAKDYKQVLSETHRVLKKGGKLIMFDGFRLLKIDDLSPNLAESVILTEKSMAVNQFAYIDEWIKVAEEVGFKVKIANDLSTAIMPDIARLQYIARGYFKFPFLSKALLKILPYDMVMNAIAGVLIPFALYHKGICYYKLVLEKV